MARAVWWTSTAALRSLAQAIFASTLAQGAEAGALDAATAIVVVGGADRNALALARTALSTWENDKNKKGVSYNDLVAVAKATGYEVEFFTPRDMTFTEAVTGGYGQTELDFDTTYVLKWHPSLVAA
jgi:transcriptional regulator with XRE-family HTH domain